MRARPIQSFIDSVGPRHHFVVVVARIEQFCRERGLIVPFVVLPIAWPVFNRVGQEEDLAPSGCRHRLHATVFQEGGFKYTLFFHTIIVVGLSRSAGPHLGDVAVDAIKRGQAGFRADDPPLTVVEQGVSGNVHAYIQAFRPAILFGIRSNLVQGTIIELILQFVGKIGVFRRQMLCLPFCTVIGFPLSFERVTVTTACPKLRFLQKDGVNTGVNHSFDLRLLEVANIVQGGNDVWNHVSVPYRVIIEGYLPFVQMFLSVPAPVEVVLIFAPGYSGHEVGDIAAFSPRLHSFFQVCTCTIAHHGVGPHVCGGLPALSGLKRGSYAVVNSLGRHRSTPATHSDQCRQESFHHGN